MSEIQELKSMGRMLQGITDPRSKDLFRVIMDNIGRLDHNSSHHASNPVPRDQLGSPFIYPEEVLWTDYLAPMAMGKSVSGSPIMAPFGPSGNLEALKFGAGDAVMLYYHINHDIKQGTNIYPHVHWATSGVDTGTTGATWNIEYSFAKGHNQEPFPAPTNFNLAEQPSGVAWQTMITEASAGDSFEAPEVDSIVIMRVELLAEDVTDNVFGLFVDLHVEIDRPGTPNKAPDFYKT
ncbi:MAG: hypothetical protein JRJ14_07915 [Deltaproteobacteria bacterium]|nr:hypothetical protein [Deltaproteobacteria bacterium]